MAFVFTLTKPRMYVQKTKRLRDKCGGSEAWAMERPRAYFLWRFVESCSIFYHIYAFQVRQTSGVVPFDLFKCSGASSFNTANVECVCVWGGGGILPYICYTGMCRTSVFFFK